VTLSHEVHPDARTAILDRGQVLHAVDALVRNGIRFTPDGGLVVVRAFVREEDFGIEVRDTGIGMSEEARKRLFDDNYVMHDSKHHRTADRARVQRGRHGLRAGVGAPRRRRSRWPAHGGRPRGPRQRVHR
jgi:signal transduction histidine kinase